MLRSGTQKRINTVCGPIRVAIAMAHAWNLSGMVVESDCQMLINLLSQAGSKGDGWI